MWKIVKMTKENTTWEDLLKYWEDCNNDRLKYLDENINLRKQVSIFRKEAEKYERLMYEARKERDILRDNK